MNNVWGMVRTSARIITDIFWFGFVKFTPKQASFIRHLAVFSSKVAKNFQKLPKTSPLFFKMRKSPEIEPYRFGLQCYTWKIKVDF
ncbi:MAG TPA: hypothetical protein DDZ04_04180 [Parabacteroides sp.]|nr:hypothetical protein [Parabacteroides sp.]